MLYFGFAGDLDPTRWAHTNRGPEANATTMRPKIFRCPECYARVVGGPEDDAQTALWLHGLSGRCRAKLTAKAEKPRRKERLEAMLGEEWG